MSARTVGFGVIKRLAIVLVPSLMVAVLAAAPVLAAPELALSPTSGALGTRVTVSGANFESYRGDSVSIYFNGAEVDTLVIPDDGSFSTDFFIPDDASIGVSYVTVGDDLGNQLGSKKAFVVDDLDVFLYPEEGVVGTDVSLTGKGLYSEGRVLVYYNGERLDTGSATAGPTGDFSYDFVALDSAAGEHAVRVEDALGNWDEAKFDIKPMMSLGTAKAATGDEITVSGSGFGGRMKVAVSFHDIEVATEQTDRNGAFEVEFQVPVMPPGEYEITVEDAVGNRTEADFTISAGINLSYYQGHVGLALGVEGMGFLTDQTVAVKYNNIQVAQVPTDGNGAFSCEFIVPASTGGNHIVAVYDGTNEVTRVFTVESDAPPVPTLVIPEDGAQDSPAAYFDWNDVTDMSGVTYTLQIGIDPEFSAIVLESEGIPSSDYLLADTDELSPTTEDSPYYWRVKAVDGAANESEWSEPWAFYVKSGFSLSAPARNALIAAGVTAAIFLGVWIGRRTAYSKV